MEYWNNPKLISNIKRRRKQPKIGDYVLLSKYSDIDANDPWCIGILGRIITDKMGTRYYTEDFYRGFKNAKIIKAHEGHELLNKE